jgi:ADP-ribose pyrophosphatase
VRQRIPIDSALWVIECEEYAPPYHVDETVLEGDRTVVPGGWADPEDFEKVADTVITGSSKQRDDGGRPLNPRGRTGIAGRGLLGRWGANPAVAAIVTRANEEGSRIDILLGKKEGAPGFWLPRGFARLDEGPQDAVCRVLEEETGCQPGCREGVAVFDGYSYDSRQTDHAWVEIRASLLHHTADTAPGSFRPGGEFEEVQWQPLDADTVNRMPSGEARFVREAVKRLRDTSAIDADQARSLLASTG